LLKVYIAEVCAYDLIKCLTFVFNDYGQGNVPTLMYHLPSYICLVKVKNHTYF